MTGSRDPSGRRRGGSAGDNASFTDRTYSDEDLIRIAHALIVALRAAAVALDGWNLAGCTLAVTVEPCTMCAGAIGAARVDRVVFGCWEPKTGAAGSLWDVLRDRRLTHRVEVRGGVLEAECAALVREFFAGRRD